MPRLFGIEELREALDLVLETDDDIAEGLAIHLHLALKSAVRAVTPGRQQKKNLDPVVHDAQKAFIRTLRRRGKGRAAS